MIKFLIALFVLGCIFFATGPVLTSDVKEECDKNERP